MLRTIGDLLGYGALLYEKGNGMGIKAVVFDMDGTILHTLPDLTVVTNRAMERMGYPLHTQEEVLTYVGNGAKRLVNQACPEGTSEEDRERTLELWQQIYLDYDNDLTAPFPGIEDTLRALRDKGIKTAVLTNGTLIGLREARMLKASGVSYVQVSLDGTKKVHDRIRGEGSFDLAVNGLRELAAQGIFTTVSFTAQRENLGELKKLAKLCGGIGADKLWYDRVVIPAGEDDGRLSLTADDFAKLSRQASRLNKKGMVSCARALQFIPCEKKSIYRCTAGERLLAVLADGTVMACRRLPVKCGSVRDSSLLRIYRSDPEILKLRSAPVPKACAGCEYSRLCGGGAKCVTFAKTGRYDLPDPDCPYLRK